MDHTNQEENNEILLSKHFDKLTKNVFRLIQEENSEIYFIQAIFNSAKDGRHDRGALLFEFENILDVLLPEEEHHHRHRVTFLPEEQLYIPEFAPLIEGYIKRYNPLREFVAVCIFHDHPNHAIRAEIIQREKKDNITIEGNKNIWKPNKCYHCLKENNNNVKTINQEKSFFYRCHGCEMIPYCSLTCQKEDWFHGNHHVLCDYINKINGKKFTYPIQI